MDQFCVICTETAAILCSRFRAELKNKPNKKRRVKNNINYTWRKKEPKGEVIEGF